MERLRRTLESCWPLAFLWLLFVPIVTVPWTYKATERLAYGGACQEGPTIPQYVFGPDRQWSCPLSQSLLTHAPGLLNLVPAIWLVARSRRVRLAAAIATTAGAIRLLVPTLPILFEAHLVCLSGLRFGCVFQTSFGDLRWLGFFGWIGTAGVALVFSRWFRLDDAKRSPRTSA